MILYDNGDSIAVLFQIYGSVLPDCIPTALFSFTIGCTLAVLRECTDVLENQPLYFILDTFTIRTIAVVMGILLATRTNMALDRWMDGISQVQLMLSKWGDAFIALSGFFSSKVCTEEQQHRILMFRVRIAHWFSLMSCLAFATLRASQLTNLDDVPIREMFPDTEENGAEAEMKPSKSFTSERRNIDEEHLNNFKFRSTYQEGEENRNMSSLDLLVLSAPSREEVELLDMSVDKVNAVYLWIIQGVSEEVRAKTLDAPPPIVSRVYQEVSNGKLGFNQAHKVAMVPFPFPFAQMVSILLCFLYIVVPFYVDAFTQNIVVTPLISFVIPVAYHGLNHIAIELEEPFGLDYNDIDIEGRHTEFLQMLVDTIRQPIIPPVSKENSLEGRIRKGCTKRHQRILKEIGSPMVLPKDLDQEGGGADVMSRDLADLVNGSMAAYNYDKDPAVEVEETWLDESHREESFGSLLYSQGLSWSR
mmetsp:Transcript_14751/g.27932  ORF Transcript_14751/g.27932 Transcript_14751/m.27932 type:complete len:475 (-) Transcript_14751:225-1649(-)